MPPAYHQLCTTLHRLDITPVTRGHPHKDMPATLLASFDKAVADIADGSSVMFGGFGPGTPRNLIAALVRKGAKNLTIIVNTPTTVSGRFDVLHLLEHNQVKKVICSFMVKGDPLNTQKSGNGHAPVEVEMVPQGTLAERIRAGGAGIPALYLPVGTGTEIARGKEVRAFGGVPCLLEHALTADYAFIRAWKADAFGNLVYRLTQRNFNPLMAMAAKCVIAEVEEPVASEPIDPDHVHTPGIFVQRVVKIPPAPEGLWEEPWAVWE